MCKEIEDIEIEIKYLEDELFMLEMGDRLNSEERKQVYKISRKIKELKVELDRLYDN